MDWGDCVENGVATLRCIPVLFNNVIRGALSFVGITALFFIVYAGFSFVNSGGDPKKVQGARQIMTYAIIGLIIVLLSFAILFFIGWTTGSYDCITSFSDSAKFLTGCE